MSLSKLNIASRQGNGDAAQGDTRYALRASLSRASRQQVLAGKWGCRTPQHGLWGGEWCRRCGDGRVAALTVVRTAGSPSVCHRMMSEVLRPHGDVAQSSGSKAVRSPCVGLEDVMPSELRKSRKDTLRLLWTGRPGVADAQRQSRRARQLGRRFHAPQRVRCASAPGSAGSTLSRAPDFVRVHQALFPVTATQGAPRPPTDRETSRLEPPPGSQEHDACAVSPERHPAGDWRRDLRSVSGAVSFSLEPEKSAPVSWVRGPVLDRGGGWRGAQVCPRFCHRTMRLLLQPWPLGAHGVAGRRHAWSLLTAALCRPALPRLAREPFLLRRLASPAEVRPGAWELPGERQAALRGWGSPSASSCCVSREYSSRWTGTHPAF